MLSLLEELAQKQEDVSPAAPWWDPPQKTHLLPMAAPSVQLGSVGQGGPRAKPPWVDRGWCVRFGLGVIALGPNPHITSSAWFSCWGCRGKVRQVLRRAVTGDSALPGCSVSSIKWRSVHFEQLSAVVREHLALFLSAWSFQKDLELGSDLGAWLWLRGPWARLQQAGSRSVPWGGSPRP